MLAMPGERNRAQQVVYDVMPHCLEFGYYEAIFNYTINKEGKNSGRRIKFHTHYFKYPINCGP